MIVNKYSVLAAFLAALGLALAALLAAAALWTAWRIGAARGERQQSAAERSGHLATLVAAVCLAILALSWPLFYATLNSFVPEIPGAMCIYGVTKVMPAATVLIQAAQPLVIFLLGAWLLLDRVRRQSGAAVARARGMAALAIVAGLVAFAHGAELYYVFNMTSLHEVSCCSGRIAGAGAKLQAPAYYLPWTLPTPALAILLNVLFFAGVPLLALWLLRLWRRGAPGRRALAQAGSAALLVAAAGIGVAASLEFSEVLAPLLMRLPFHHCVYCLLLNGRAPDAPIMAANVALGVFAAGWVAILGFAAPMGSAPAAVLRRRLCVLGATTLAASVLMVIIHLAVYRG